MRYPKTELQRTIEEIQRQHYDSGWQATYSMNLSEWLSENSELILQWSAMVVKVNTDPDHVELNEDFERRVGIEQQLLKGIYEAVLADQDFVREENEDIIQEVLEA